MEIKNINNFGGTQNFADLIINTSSVFDDSDKRILDLIDKYCANEEEKKSLIVDLESINSQEDFTPAKEISKSRVKSFFDTVVNETGKQVVKEAFDQTDKFGDLISMFLG